MAESGTSNVEQNPVAQVLAKVAAEVIDQELDAHRILVSRANDELWVFRVYARNDKDYEGGTITV